MGKKAGSTRSFQRWGVRHPRQVCRCPAPFSSCTRDQQQPPSLTALPGGIPLQRSLGLPLWYQCLGQVLLRAARRCEATQGLQRDVGSQKPWSTPASSLPGGSDPQTPRTDRSTAPPAAQAKLLECGTSAWKCGVGGGCVVRREKPAQPRCPSIPPRDTTAPRRAERSRGHRSPPPLPNVSGNTSHLQTSSPAFHTATAGESNGGARRAAPFPPPLLPSS